MGVKETCSKCQHFSALDSQCRKRAPKVFVYQEGALTKLSSFFPPTKPENWCSEFEVVKVEVAQ